MEKLKLHLGCGTKVVEGWVNIDYNLGARLAKIPLCKPALRAIGLLKDEWDSRIYIYDLRRRLPYADNTVDCIYTSHTLEHLTRKHGWRLIQESYRVLKPNGVIRIVVPDLNAIVQQYVSGKIRSDDFLEHLHVCDENENKSGFRPFIRRTILAPYIHFPHRCMYDTPRLVEILTEAGFEAAVKNPFESDIEDISKLETEERTIDAVIVEAKKPNNAGENKDSHKHAIASV